MNTPLISPWFVYLLGILPGVRIAVLIIGISLVFGATAMLIGISGGEGLSDYFGNALSLAANLNSYLKHPDTSDYNKSWAEHAYRKCEEMSEEFKAWRKGGIALFVIGAVFIFIFLLTPTRETLIAIEISKLITIENVTWTVDQLKALADYIVESIARIAGSL